MRRLLVAVAATVLTLVGTVASAGAATTHHRHPDPPGPAGQIQGLFQDESGTNYDWSVVAPEYHVFILNDWEASWAAQIHQYNPSAVVLVYKDLWSVRSDDCTGAPDGSDACIVNGVFCPQGVTDKATFAGGLPFCWTWRNHPGWFAKDANGNLVQYNGFPGVYMTRAGAPGYQAAWAIFVGSDLIQNGWDGIFADNAIDTTGYGTTSEYTNDAQFQAATQSMLSFVGPIIKDVGFKIIPNLGDNNVYPQLWSQWLPYVSGFYNEFYTYWPGPGDQGGWSQWTEPQVQACAQAGDLCLFHVAGHSDTLTQAQIDYAAGNFLLQSDGNSAMSFGADQSANPNINLGDATGAAVNNGDGTWSRTFTCGTVTVNPGSNGVGGSATLPPNCATSTSNRGR